MPWSVNFWVAECGKDTLDCFDWLISKRGPRQKRESEEVALTAPSNDAYVRERSYGPQFLPTVSGLWPRGKWVGDG
jgi:hypothetical protein